MSRRSVAVAAALALLSALLLTACGSSATPSPRGQVHRITVDASGRPAGGLAHVVVRQGDPVKLVVRSAVADEIHVHGYDLHRDVARGGTARFDFPASITGIFVVELESRSEQIARLEVEPT